MSVFCTQEQLKTSPTKANNPDLSFNFSTFFLSLSPSIYTLSHSFSVYLFIYISLSLSLHLWLC